MSTRAKGIKYVTIPTIVGKATTTIAAITTKTDAPQSLKDKATALAVVIADYNTAVDSFNSEGQNVVIPYAASVNNGLALIKTGYAELKTLAKGLHNVGLATSADLATITFF